MNINVQGNTLTIELESGEEAPQISTVNDQAVSLHRDALTSLGRLIEYKIVSDDETTSQDESEEFQRLIQRQLSGISG